MVEEKKFLFEESFDDVPTIVELSTMHQERHTYFEEEVFLIRQEEYKKGLEAGQAQEQKSIEYGTLATLENLSRQLQAFMDRERQAFSLLDTEMIKMAREIVKKILPASCEQGALAEVESIAKSCLQKVRREPLVRLYANEEMASRLEEYIQKIVQDSGFHGQVTVNPDRSLEISDCRLEWQEGGLTRSVQHIWHEITQAIERIEKIETVENINSEAAQEEGAPL